LVGFLGNSGFEVLRREGEVHVPAADAHLLVPVLAIWNELHPDAKAELVPE
jgi:hypothetical protein